MAAVATAMVGAQASLAKSILNIIQPLLDQQSKTFFAKLDTLAAYVTEKVDDETEQPEEGYTELQAKVARLEVGPCAPPTFRAGGCSSWAAVAPASSFVAT